MKSLNAIVALVVICACALALVLVSLATCKKHPSTFLDPREKAAA